MEAPGLGRQMGIRVRLAGEGSCPQEACQVNPLELPTTEPEKSHIGYSLEPDSTRVSRQCLLNRCSWQKAVASTKSERERDFFLECCWDHQLPLEPGFIQEGVSCPCVGTGAARKASLEACVSFLPAPLPRRGQRASDASATDFTPWCWGYGGNAEPKWGLNYGKQRWGLFSLHSCQLHEFPH